MSDLVAEWNKELRVLLDRMRAGPSADWKVEFERVRLLSGLIGARQPTVANAQG